MSTNFVYSVDNRLQRVENVGGSTVPGYYYDPFGRRLWKEVGGTRTYFHYNDEGLAGEYDASGVELRTYGYHTGAAWSSNPLFVQESGEYYWYQNDHLGTPQKIIAENGEVVWSARCDGFGRATVDVETVVNNLRFPGQYFDGETGLHYNYHRYYDPSTGRYISADPIGLRGGINLYGYVGNDPVNGVDPWGLETTGEWIVPPKYNMTGVGNFRIKWDNLDFNKWGYLTSARAYGTLHGFINIDIKCKCGNNEWEIHKKINKNLDGSIPVGINVYAIGGSVISGSPWIGASIWATMAGGALLELEYDLLKRASDKFGPLIRLVLRAGPTAVCIASRVF